MKTIYNFTICFAFMLLTAGIIRGQTTIVKWDFNSETGTITPAVGSGTAMLIGTSGTFKSGVGSTDLAAYPPNYGWQTSSYANSKTENKRCGIQFNVSTVGYRGITFKFDQRLSNTANNTYVVQYTIDRTVATPAWVDAQMFTFVPAATGTAEIWYKGRTVDLSMVSALDNNPNAGIRIVSAFDPLVSDYVAADSSVEYGGGAVRFDMISISAAKTLGVNDYSYNKPSFSFYPNPTKGDVIHFNEPVSVKIFDVTGKMIMNFKNVKDLNLENLTSGIYFIENENKEVIKMIKN